MIPLEQSIMHDSSSWQCLSVIFNENFFGFISQRWNQKVNQAEINVNIKQYI